MFRFASRKREDRPNERSSTGNWGAESHRTIRSLQSKISGGDDNDSEPAHLTVVSEVEVDVVKRRTMLISSLLQIHVDKSICNRVSLFFGEPEDDAHQGKGKAEAKLSGEPAAKSKYWDLVFLRGTGSSARNGFVELLTRQSRILQDDYGDASDMVLIDEETMMEVKPGNLNRWRLGMQSAPSEIMLGTLKEEVEADSGMKNEVSRTRRYSSIGEAVGAKRVEEIDEKTVDSLEAKYGEDGLVRRGRRLSIAPNRERWEKEQGKRSSMLGNLG
jgi:hypothetical protein